MDFSSPRLLQPRQNAGSVDVIKGSVSHNRIGHNPLCLLSRNGRQVGGSIVDVKLPTRDAGGQGESKDREGPRSDSLME